MSKILQRSLEGKLPTLEEWSSDESEAEEQTKSVGEQKKLKSRTKEKKSKNKDGEKEKKELSNEASSVIYLGHLPQEFEEAQIIRFFSQFGTVTNVKLFRSKRTRNSKGYAFIKFADKEVASIAASSMSGYFLMGEKRLVCHVVSQENVHKHLFTGSKQNMMMSMKGESISSIKKMRIRNSRQVNSKKSASSMKKITERLLKREEAKRKKLSSLGIDYDFPGYTHSINKVNESLDKKKDIAAIQNESNNSGGKKTSTKSSTEKMRKHSEVDIKSTESESNAKRKKITSNNEEEKLEEKLLDKHESKKKVKKAKRSKSKDSKRSTETAEDSSNKTKEKKTKKKDSVTTIESEPGNIQKKSEDCQTPTKKTRSKATSERKRNKKAKKKRRQSV